MWRLARGRSGLASPLPLVRVGQAPRIIRDQLGVGLTRASDVARGQNRRSNAGRQTAFDSAQHHALEQEGTDYGGRRRYPQAWPNLHERVARLASVVENDVRKLVQLLA